MDGLLDAALESPYAGFDETDLYPTTEAKAARLVFGLIKNHLFVDGNKRIGVMAMLVLLDTNGIHLAVADEDLIWLGLSLATGELDTSDVLRWIEQHTVRRD